VEIRKLMLGQLKVDKNEVTAILSRRWSQTFPSTMAVLVGI
jgi:hypothetical protein